MTLAYELENLDGVDESIAKHYSEKDGKFYLTVDGHDKNEKDRIPKFRLDQEISKRKEAETELSNIAEDLKKDVPEEYKDCVPDIAPGKLISWLRNASAKRLFDTKFKDSIDSKRPSNQKPQDFSIMNPIELIEHGLKNPKK